MKHKTLYFDCFAGASGDMIVGTLLDLGLDQEMFKNELAKLPLTGYQLQIRKTIKDGFSATKFDVLDESGRSFDSHAHDDHAHDDHAHDDHVHDDHGHSHAHHHEHHSDHKGGGHQWTHRNLKDIENLIESSDLALPVKAKSIAVFRKLAQAEAKIHGTSLEQIHFHEVGAVDAIVDIVGAVTALHLLEIEKIVVSPLPLGKGFVHCQHGVIPVPAPATLELLTGMPTFGSEHKGETVTPTGAAILAALSYSYGSMPSIDILKVGYGAGTRNFGVPNVLRAVMGWESQYTVLNQNFTSTDIA